MDFKYQSHQPFEPCMYELKAICLQEIKTKSSTIIVHLIFKKQSKSEEKVTKGDLVHSLTFHCDQSASKKSIS